MKYAFTDRVRYSETDQDAKLTLDGLINYFQDCSLFHSMDVGLGLDYLEERKEAWMLTAWQIIIEDMPKLGDTVKTSTWAYDFHGCNGFRNFTMENEKDELLACANSYWCYIDMTSGRPTNVPENTGIAYGLEEKLSMDEDPKKIKIEGEETIGQTFSVHPNHLDTNHHVNNGQYVLMAMGYLPEGYKIRQMRAEYKRQAKLDDLITPKIYKGDKAYVVALCNENGKPYAVVEFQE